MLILVALSIFLSLPLITTPHPKRLRIRACFRQQLCVRPRFHYLSGFQHENGVAKSRRRKPVRNKHSAFLLRHFVISLIQLILRQRVQRRSRLVQQNQLRIALQRTRPEQLL